MVVINMMSTIALFGEVLADVFPDKTVLGGAPYNVARHLRAFQQHPVLISRVGDDALKKQLFAELSLRDIDTAGIQLDPTHPTGQVTVHIAHDRHRFEINPNQAYDYIDASLATRTSLSIKPNIAYFGSLIQRNSTSRAALDNFLNNTACTKFLDINLREPWYNKVIIEYSLQQANIVKVSEEELAMIAQMLALNSQPDKEHAATLIQKFNLATLYVTCGEHGAWTILPSGEKLEIENQKLESTLIDTVGAGDAFSAICILGNLYHWPIERTLKRATRFATALCEIRGAAPDTTDFYLPFLKWMNNHAELD